MDSNEAWARAAAQVVAEQCQRVAIPRRFTFTMEEIWSLQPRFEQIQRKRVFRLMTHPRFRAAFDFLLLRADESPAMRELGQWWAHAQQLPQDVLAAALPAGGGSHASDNMPMPSGRSAAASASASPQAGRQIGLGVTLAYVALGSNLGDSRQQVLDAMDALAALPDTRLLQRSHLYLTPPWGVLEQPPFVNAAVRWIPRYRRTRCWMRCWDRTAAGRCALSATARACWIWICCMSMVCSLTMNVLTCRIHAWPSGPSCCYRCAILHLRWRCLDRAVAELLARLDLERLRKHCLEPFTAARRIIGARCPLLP
jgi:hypothetical protein